MGRPKKTLDILPEGWKTSILKMYEVGASDAEVKGWLLTQCGSFSNDLWTRFMEEEEDFSEAVKRGRKMSAYWWQSQGRINLENNKFNATLWYMNMKNRFGWADKQENKHKVEGKISFEWGGDN